MTPINRPNGEYTGCPRDKKAIQRVLQEINQLYQGYAQVWQNALQQVKAQFNAQLDSVRKSLKTKCSGL